jgi:hypothetical protein
LGGHARIGTGRCALLLALCGIISINHPNSMHLIEPDGIRRQQPPQDLPIFMNNCWNIPCTQA